MAIEYSHKTVNGSSYQTLVDGTTPRGQTAGVILDGKYVVGTVTFEVPGTRAERIKLQEEKRWLGDIGGDAMVAHWPGDYGKLVKAYLDSNPTIPDTVKGALGLLDNLRTQNMLVEPRSSGRSL